MIVNLKTTAFLHLCVSIVVISRAMSCVCHVVVFALSCKHLMFRMTPISPFVVPWHLIISINIEKYNFVAPLQARHCMQQETWHDTTWKAANSKMIFGLKVISSCIFVIRQYSAWENQHVYELRRHIIYQTQCTHTYTHTYVYILIQYKSNVPLHWMSYITSRCMYLRNMMCIVFNNIPFDKANTFVTWGIVQWKHDQLSDTAQKI